MTCALVGGCLQSRLFEPTRPLTGLQVCRASVGIDLGTSNSIVASVRDGKPMVIAAHDGSVLLPSVVRYTSAGVLVGRAAQEAADEDPANTFYCVKRIIGRRLNDVQGMQAGLTYGLTSSADGMALLECSVAGMDALMPEQVSSEIIKVLKARAEESLGEPVDRAVITVPAHFSDSQRLATMSAAIAAGIERVSLLQANTSAPDLVAKLLAPGTRIKLSSASAGWRGANLALFMLPSSVDAAIALYRRSTRDMGVGVQEPVAAAMAYGLGKPHDEQPAILVFDLGGGTFDVSLLQSFEGIMDVVGSDGDNQLGGFDLDSAVVDFVLEHACSPGEAESVRADAKSLHRLRQVAERCKIELSSSPTTVFHVDGLAGGAAIELAISVADLQRIVQPVFERLWAPLDALGSEYKLAYAFRPDGLAPAALNSTDRFAPPPRALSQLVLVGGATKAPMVAAFAEAVAGVKACVGVDPELCVALGAAIQAGIMDGSLSGGLEIMDSLYVQSLQGRISGFQM